MPPMSTSNPSHGAVVVVRLVVVVVGVAGRVDVPTDVTVVGAVVPVEPRMVVVEVSARTVVVMVVGGW